MAVVTMNGNMKTAVSKGLLEETVEQDAVSFSLEYRAVLKETDEQLVRRDVATLIFLVSDIVPPSRSETIRRGIDLFDELEQKGRLDAGNVVLLAELFYRIQRIDLVKKLGFTQRDVEEKLERDGSELKQFRLMLFDITENLTSADCQALKFVIQPGLPRLKKDTGRDAMQMFSAMEKAQTLTPDDLQSLIRALDSIGRSDLVEKVNYFKENGTVMPEKLAKQLTAQCTPSAPPKSDNQMKNSTLLSHRRQEFVPVAPLYPSVIQCFNKTPGKDSLVLNTGRTIELDNVLGAGDENVSMTTGEAGINYVEEVEPPAPAQNYDREQAEQREKEFLEEIERLREQLQQTHLRSNVAAYPMDSTPRGLCVIISNEKFYKIEGDCDSKSMPDRHGTERDHGNLDFIFNKLNFDVQLCENLSSSQMIQEMMRVAMMDHSRYSCFVCCILTHGEAQSVFGADGKKVPIRELTKFFTAHTCETLKDKPKLFFIQACQGIERMKAVDIERDAPGDIMDETIPNEADFLLSYATLPGYVSFRSRTHGSWYITKLVEMLDLHADSEDILSILLLVNLEVGRAIAKIEGGIYKQIPAPTFTLRKKLFFS